MGLCHKFVPENSEIFQNVFIRQWLTETEAVTGDVLWKKVFLEISQNSQGNTGIRVSFLIKLQAQGLEL